MRLHKTLGILESDLKPLLLLGAIHFAVASSHALFDIGATSLLVAHLGPETLPQVYVGSALLLIVAGLFFIPVIDRLDRARLFGASLVVFAAVLGLAHHVGPRAPELVYRGLYLLCYLLKSLLFLQFWLIAADVCELRQAKRLFPILLGFSLAGGLVASLAASILPRSIRTEDLLAAAGVGLCIGLLPTVRVHRCFRDRLKPPPLRVPFRPRDALGQLRSDLSIAFETPLLRNLSLCCLLFALLAQVLDYFMGKAASLHFVDAAGRVDPRSLTGFYAALNGTVIGIGALVQFLMANRFLSSVGVTRGQLAGPLAFVAAFGAITTVLFGSLDGLGAEFFFVVVAGRGVQKIVRVSIYRSSTDLMFNPIPGERRGRAKAFKETMIEPAGVLAGGMFLILGRYLPLGLLAGASLVISALFLALSMRLKTHYIDSLVHVLKEKSRFRFAFPSTIRRPVPRAVDPTGVVSDLERALEDEEISVRLLAVEVAAELREPAAAPLLVRRFRQEPDPKVRATMVAALGKLLRRRFDTLEALEPSLVDADPRVRANGIEALALIGMSEAGALLPPFTRDAEPRIRANAAVAISRLEGEGGAGKGREILFDMYDSRESASRLSGIYGLGEIGDGESLDRLETALSDPSPLVRHRALMSLARSGRREAIDRLIQCLEEGTGATRHVTARALEACGPAAVDPLIVALWGSEVEVRRYVIETLGRIGSLRARQALIHILSLEAEEAYYDLLRLETIRKLPLTSGVRLIAATLQERVEQAKRNALMVLRSVYGDRRGMRLVLSNLNHPEPYVRASAIEALEVRADPSLVGGILPLFEHSSPKVVAEHGSSHFRLPSRGPLEALFELASDRSGWLRACALFTVGQLGSHDALPLLARRVSDPYELVRLNAIEAMGRVAGEAALPLLERLRQVHEGPTREYCERAIIQIRARRSGEGE